MKWFLALVAASFVLVASAIEPPKPATAPEAPPAKSAPAQPAPAAPSPPAAQPAGDAAEPAAGASKPVDTAAAGDEEELPPLPADAEPAGPPPQRFNPTEKVRADFPVSFPIDI